MDKDKLLIAPGVLQQFGIDPAAVAIIPVQQGLINHTWKLEGDERSYILQSVNTAVFKNPGDLAFNIDSLAHYLGTHYPGYIFTTPLKTIDGSTLYHSGENYYRLFAFIEGSHTIPSVETAAQAYEAARQFGKFTAVLKNFDASVLRPAIPRFHDLGYRYQQFIQAVQNGNPQRIQQSEELIAAIKNWSHIAEYFESIKSDPDFKLRVTHHDTKISNVLFDENNKGICVIDLDTVMPGYFISDVGDMMRTYLCPVTEEERDTSKIKVRPDIYHALVKGYLEEMNGELSKKEQQHFFYAGSFMIYMQALRFITDHLNNDVYYGASYEGHNFSRAYNQLALLQQFFLLKNVLEQPVATV